MSNEEGVQEDIFAALDAAMAQPLYETAIPDSQTAKRDSSGKVIPYIAIQFGDLNDAGNTSFGGVRTSDYEMPVYIQSVGPTPKIARQISNRVKDKMLGLDFEWTGEVRKRAGGGVFNMVASTGATEAYVAASSFTVTMQYE